MSDTMKRIPGGAPAAPAELARSVQLAAENAELAQGIHVRMVIEGGQFAERYSFHFEASGGGPVSARMNCRMTGREARARVETVSREDFAHLLQAADILKLQEVRQPPYRIPPCSLVGRIEITDGRQKVSFVFMADRAQAETAGMVPPPELTRLIDRIFEVSARYMEAPAGQGIRP